jgi:hypothetical protein
VYKSVGEAQKHTYGEGAPGTKPPDFKHLPAPGQPVPTAAPPAPATKGGEPANPVPGRGAVPTPPNKNPGAASTPAKPPSPNRPAEGRRSNQAAGGPGGPADQ